MAMSGAPWAYDGNVWHQGVTHLTYIRTIDKDLSCFLERERKLGSMPKERTRLPSETWAH
jgi:hypothetical protein